jgi:hypothetical protein
MAARTLTQIIAELNPTFQSQIKSLEDRANLIPGQIASEESALGAQKDKAYEDIVSGARRRGLGFSGVPLEEQAKYAATDYAPALARLRQSGQDRVMSLQDAILGINERRDTLGQQIYQTEQDRAAQERASVRAAASAAAPSFGNLFGGGGNTGGGNNPALPKISRDSKGGYGFTDAYGKPINAAEYVQLYNSMGGRIGYRELLSQMASTGDKNAQIALQYVGNDAGFGNAPTQYQGALSALGATGTYKDPRRAGQTTTNPTTFMNNKSLIGNIFPGYGR